MYHYCIYRSRSKVGPGSRDCAHVYLEARWKNQNTEITGYLHHEDGFFVQYVEGSLRAITELLDKIRCDYRHHQVDFLHSGEIAERLFPQWDMAFSDQELAAYQTWAGDHGSISTIATGTFQDLLMLFADTRPQNSRLDCQSLEATFGMMQPDWKRAIQEIVEEVK